jgi:hypothetical protein
METNMINSVETMIDQGKKSLETLLREKAYGEVQEVLNEQGITIESVSDADVEALVAERVKEKKNGMKSFAMGGAFALLLSSVIGF